MLCVHAAAGFEGVEIYRILGYLTKALFSCAGYHMGACNACAACKPQCGLRQCAAAEGVLTFITSMNICIVIEQRTTHLSSSFAVRVNIEPTAVVQAGPRS